MPAILLIHFGKNDYCKSPIPNATTNALNLTSATINIDKTNLCCTQKMTTELKCHYLMAIFEENLIFFRSLLEDDIKNNVCKTCTEHFISLAQREWFKPTLGQAQKYYFQY